MCVVVFIDTFSGAGKDQSGAACGERLLADSSKSCLANGLRRFRELGADDQSAMAVPMAQQLLLMGPRRE